MRKVFTPNLETDRAGPATPDAIRKEVRRKIFHLCTLIFLAGYYVIGPERVLAPMVVWTAIVLAFELIRFHTAWGRDWTQRHFGFMIRAKEASHFTGLFYTTLGALLVFLFFRRHPRVVQVSLLYLALGDAISAVVGLTWGRHPYWILGRKRTWEGSLAGFATAVAVGMANGLGIPLTAAGALAFSVADTVPLPPDDNVWIPLLPGAVLLAFLGTT